jgi:hypothetical protein
MKKQKRQEQDWTKRLRKHRENCELTRDALMELDQEFEDGGDLRPLLHRLRNQIREICGDAGWLHETICVAPIRTAFSLNRMNITEQQYWFLRAAGLELFTAKTLGIAPLSDYEVYQNCVYEDDEIVCFVDPDETPEVETVHKKTGSTSIRIRLAHSPEECKLRHFRPEQKRFFAKYRPDVLARAKQTERSSGTDASLPQEATPEAKETRISKTHQTETMCEGRPVEQRTMQIHTAT